ncbi:hypothetical protein BS47DRAFT_523536 [Hydnum rufescens UP504]|uniref:Uncharacterized protein n=1 Tax=Hydnum rufescens UP504 TaxID=1448309 RepID=A0A9P6B421_9AGAM|nr:hypothetical protein BS47DRAFT_523536 [Hydnum rufescens UP504]
MQESTSRSSDRPQISPTGRLLRAKAQLIDSGLNPYLGRPQIRHKDHHQRIPFSYHGVSLQRCKYPLMSFKTSAQLPDTFRINGLKWYKHRAGVKHEFVILEVERPARNNLWLRIDREQIDETTSAQILSSNAEPADTGCVTMRIS